jgi:hypothetical protein
MFHGEIASQLKWRGLTEEGKSSLHLDTIVKAEKKRSDYIIHLLYGWVK